MAALPAIFSFSPNPGFYRPIITIFQQIKAGAFLPASKGKYDIFLPGLPFKVFREGGAQVAGY
jgi:hypothetical protein